MAYILIVDDDIYVADTIERGLREKGYQTTVAYDGIEALIAVREHRPDLLVLDIAMPQMDGIEVCRRLRSNPSTATLPIIFLTARSMIDDKVEGFEAGADDYLTKPFDIQELELRVRALLRRSEPIAPETQPTTIQVGDFILNSRSFEVTTPDRRVLLTPTEFELYHHLMLHPDEIFTSDRLLIEVWQYPPGTGDPALVRMHIKNLRDKLEADSKHPIHLRTVSRHGYTVRPG